MVEVAIKISCSGAVAGEWLTHALPPNKDGRSRLSAARVQPVAGRFSILHRFVVGQVAPLAAVEFELGEARFDGQVVFSLR